jgi:hypothetical protein
MQPTTQLVSDDHLLSLMCSLFLLTTNRIRTRRSNRNHSYSVPAVACGVVLAVAVASERFRRWAFEPELVAAAALASVQVAAAPMSCARRLVALARVRQQEAVAMAVVAPPHLEVVIIPV